MLSTSYIRYSCSLQAVNQSVYMACYMHALWLIACTQNECMPSVYIMLQILMLTSCQSKCVHWMLQTYALCTSCQCTWNFTSAPCCLQAVNQSVYMECCIQTLCTSCQSKCTWKVINAPFIVYKLSIKVCTWNVADIRVVYKLPINVWHMQTCCVHAVIRQSNMYIECTGTHDPSNMSNKMSFIAINTFGTNGPSCL